MQEEPQNHGMERRMVHRLLMHWRSAQEDDEIPCFRDILSRDLGDIHPFIYMLQIDEEGAEPVFERIGTAFAGEGTTALVGQPVSAAPGTTLLGQASRNYGRVQSKQIPITLGSEFVHENGDTILYRSIIMPAQDHENDSRHLIGAANFKVKDA